MRFSLILLIAPAAMALATMGEPMTGNFDELETRSLEPRACKKTGCKCDTTRNRAPQGQFCGGCKCRSPSLSQLLLYCVRYRTCRSDFVKYRVRRSVRHHQEADNLPRVRVQQERRVLRLWLCQGLRG